MGKFGTWTHVDEELPPPDEKVLLWAHGRWMQGARKGCWCETAKEVGEKLPCFICRGIAEGRPLFEDCGEGFDIDATHWMEGPVGPEENTVG